MKSEGKNPFQKESVQLCLVAEQGANLGHHCWEVSGTCSCPGHLGPPKSFCDLLWATLGPMWPSSATPNIALSLGSFNRVHLSKMLRPSWPICPTDKMLFLGLWPSSRGFSSQLSQSERFLSVLSLDNIARLCIQAFKNTIACLYFILGFITPQTWLLSSPLHFLLIVRVEGGKEKDPTTRGGGGGRRKENDLAWGEGEARGADHVCVGVG